MATVISKWKYTQKSKWHLLNLKLFQTCMSFFFLLNTNKDILKNVGNQTVTSRDFHRMEKKLQWKSMATVNLRVNK